MVKELIKNKYARAFSIGIYVFFITLEIRLKAVEDNRIIKGGFGIFKEQFLRNF